MNRAHYRQFISERVVSEDRGHSTPCWIWQGFKNVKGYGRTHDIDGNVMVHRVSFLAHGGIIPEGLTLDHLCCVVSCCNPEHLEPVTASENARRRHAMVVKTHCKRGHAIIPENRSRGQCRICASMMRLAGYHRNKKVAA